jgi:hypothetical protein
MDNYFHSWGWDGEYFEVVDAREGNEKHSVVQELLFTIS